MYLFNIDLAREGKEGGHIYYFLYSCMVIYVSVMTLTDALKFSKFSYFLFTTPKYKEVAEVILIFAGMILAIFICLLFISILMHLTQKIVERIKKYGRSSMISFVTVITEILKWSVTIFLVFFIGIAGGVFLHFFVYFIENFSNIIQKHSSKRKNKNFQIRVNPMLYQNNMFLIQIFVLRYVLLLQKKRQEEKEKETRCNQALLLKYYYVKIKSRLNDMEGLVFCSIKTPKALACCPQSPTRSACWTEKPRMP